MLYKRCKIKSKLEFEIGFDKIELDHFRLISN